MADGVKFHHEPMHDHGDLAPVIFLADTWVYAIESNQDLDAVECVIRDWALESLGLNLARIRNRQEAVIDHARIINELLAD